jgi:hypothetical protein
MIDTTELVERRRHKRFRIRNGAFVILDPSDTGAGRLIDISVNGLTFDYVASQEPPIEETELQISLTYSGFRLYGVPCKAIWNLVTYEIPTTSLHTRRCGVQFGDLTPQQASQLEYFIQNHAIHDVD